MGILIILLLVLSIIGNVVYYTIRRRDRLYIKGIPFKESLDLINLPIVTFECNGHSIRLILDTGSDDSFISPTILSKLGVSPKKVCTSIGTGNGVIQSAGIVDLQLKYRESVYANTFILSDLSGAFDRIKKENGIEVHGILGSIFFTRYKYKLDFKNKIAYN